MMTAFRKARALAGQRYDRDDLLSLCDEVTIHNRPYQSDPVPTYISTEISRFEKAPIRRRISPSLWCILDVNPT